MTAADSHDTDWYVSELRALARRAVQDPTEAENLPRHPAQLEVEVAAFCGHPTPEDDPVIEVRVGTESLRVPASALAQWMRTDPGPLHLGMAVVGRDEVPPPPGVSKVIFLHESHAEMVVRRVSWLGALIRRLRWKLGLV